MCLDDLLDDGVFEFLLLGFSDGYDKGEWRSSRAGGGAHGPEILMLGKWDSGIVNEGRTWAELLLDPCAFGTGPADCVESVE